MPIPTPILDDRSYQQLRDELVRRIPVYAPEWTDHNASDPGITLIELFAFLAENLLFRFNQIPETTKLEFLRRLQIPLRPATPARALVAFTVKDPAGALVPLASTVKAGSVAFQTEDEVHAWPVSVLGVAKAQTDPPPASDTEGTDFVTRAMDAAGLQSGEPPAYYVNKVVPEDPTAPGVTAVDFHEAVDRTIWVAVCDAMGVTDPAQQVVARQQLFTAMAGQILNVAMVPAGLVDSMVDAGACPGGAAAASAPGMVWQISVNRAGPHPYETILLAGDSTRGLTQEGVVRLTMPASMAGVGVPPVSDPDQQGTRDLPPDLSDDKLTASLLFWLRAFRPAEDASSFGSVLWLGANTAGVVQANRANLEFVGIGSAQPDQQYSLINRPVIDGSVVLDVEEASGWTTWCPVEGFWASAEEDRHYVLDPEAGTIRFGNGIQGRAPQIGERIRARGYCFGGGPEGNVAVQAISQVDGAPPGVKVSNPLPAHGGGPAEAITAALDRLPGELRRRDRAVTPSDYRELALATPGARVGRAESLPLFHPADPGVQAAGVVSVMVWPVEDPRSPSAPMPERTLLADVCSWLDARRLVTAELYVIPPTYRKVAVSVGVEAKDGFGVEAVRRWVELVIRQYLAPLPPFGPDGNGWPLGRRVYGPELEAAALQVEGVDFLRGLSVAGMAADGSWVNGTVTLLPYEVPDVAEITVVAGMDPLQPGTPLGPPTLPSVPVPIPVIKETC